MKKGLLVAALSLTIATSVISGTLAAYNAQVDLTEDSVVAKAFVLDATKTESFAANTKIAPGDTKTIYFTVKNFKNAVVTETGMAVTVEAIITNNKSISTSSNIKNLEYTLTDKTADLTVKGTGAELDDNKLILTSTFEFPVQAAGQTREFELEINWPFDTYDNDTVFQGGNYGNTVKIVVNGKQIKPNN